MQGEVRSRFGLFVLESQSGGFDQYHQVLSSFLRNLGCENVEISGAKRRDRHRVETPYLGVFPSKGILVSFSGA